MIFFSKQLVVLSFGLLLYILILNQLNGFSKIIYLSQHRTPPLILMVTPFFNTSLITDETLIALQLCEFKCEISENFSLYSSADVAVFHARDMEMNEVLRTNVNPNRLNVFYSLEAYPYENIREKNFPEDFFNLTMTFRRDSNIWKPYYRFEEIEEHDSKDLIWSEEQVTNALVKKTQIAVQFVSHCATHSVRENFVERLAKFVNISSYGSCSKNIIENQDDIIEKHFFYLAFENAVCKDYVTEKFWRLTQLIVPVVLKRDILKGVVEDQYFIAADDFDTPQALAERLIYLSENKVEYRKYLGWIKKYRNIKTYDKKEYCQLCEMAYKNEKHSIQDIYHWWEEESQCQFNYSAVNL